MTVLTKVTGGKTSVEVAMTEDDGFADVDATIISGVDSEGKVTLNLSVDVCGREKEVVGSRGGDNTITGRS